jgi:hypothetical protein
MVRDRRAAMSDQKPMPRGLPREQVEAFFAPETWEPENPSLPGPEFVIDTDSFYDVMNLCTSHSPRDALLACVELAAMAPDEDALCNLGIWVLEGVIEEHWRTLGEDIDEALRQHSELRTAFTCAWLSGIPKRVENRWRALIRPEDHLGHAPEQSSN